MQVEMTMVLKTGPVGLGGETSPPDGLPVGLGGETSPVGLMVDPGTPGVRVWTMVDTTGAVVYGQSTTVAAHLETVLISVLKMVLVKVCGPPGTLVG